MAIRTMTIDECKSIHVGMRLSHTLNLVEILKANITEQEARVYLCILNNGIPLKLNSINDMVEPGGMSQEEFFETLGDLEKREMVLSGTAENSNKGYYLTQLGVAFPQNFF